VNVFERVNESNALVIVTLVRLKDSE